ncbi:hypothetical protein HDU97_006915 [Phlyctochytrium planicorne]|nr:hypothetical protein HDU97_006915 [Phlyctochytrium planicorne]
MTSPQQQRRRTSTSSSRSSLHYPSSVPSRNNTQSNGAIGDATSPFLMSGILSYRKNMSSFKRRYVILAMPTTVEQIQSVFERVFLAGMMVRGRTRDEKVHFSALRPDETPDIMDPKVCAIYGNIAKFFNEVQVGVPCHFHLRNGQDDYKFATDTSHEYQEWEDAVREGLTVVGVVEERTAENREGLEKGSPRSAPGSRGASARTTPPGSVSNGSTTSDSRPVIFPSSVSPSPSPSPTPARSLKWKSSFSCLFGRSRSMSRDRAPSRESLASTEAAPWTISPESSTSGHGRSQEGLNSGSGATRELGKKQSVSEMAPVIPVLFDFEQSRSSVNGSQATGSASTAVNGTDVSVDASHSNTSSASSGQYTTDEHGRPILAIAPVPSSARYSTNGSISTLGTHAIVNGSMDRPTSPSSSQQRSRPNSRYFPATPPIVGENREGTSYENIEYDGAGVTGLVKPMQSRRMSARDIVTKRESLVDVKSASGNQMREAPVLSEYRHSMPASAPVSQQYQEISMESAQPKAAASPAQWRDSVTKPSSNTSSVSSSSLPIETVTVVSEGSNSSSVSSADIYAKLYDHSNFEGHAVGKNLDQRLSMDESGAKNVRASVDSVRAMDQVRGSMEFARSEPALQTSVGGNNKAARTRHSVTSMRSTGLGSGGVARRVSKGSLGSLNGSAASAMPKPIASKPNNPTTPKPRPISPTSSSAIITPVLSSSPSTNPAKPRPTSPAPRSPSPANPTSPAPRRSLSPAPRRSLQLDTQRQGSQGVDMDRRASTIASLYSSSGRVTPPPGSTPTTTTPTYFAGYDAYAVAAQQHQQAVAYYAAQQQQQGASPQQQQQAVANYYAVAAAAAAAAAAAGSSPPATSPAGSSSPTSASHQQHQAHLAYYAAGSPATSATAYYAQPTQYYAAAGGSPTAPTTATANGYYQDPVAAAAAQAAYYYGYQSYYNAQTGQQQQQQASGDKSAQATQAYAYYQGQQAQQIQQQQQAAPQGQQEKK